MAAQSLADSGERLLVLDLSSGSGLVNSAAAVALRSQQWWVDNGFQRLGLAAMRVNLWVPAAGGLTWVSFLLLSFFFWWFVGVGSVIRGPQMVVTGLGGVTGFSVGLGMKNSCGAARYIRIAGAGLGLFKISWGKNLKGTVTFGWLALSIGCLRLCCMDRKSALIPKLT